jgi:plastocyanin
MRVGVLVAAAVMAFAAVSLASGGSADASLAGEKTIDMSNVKFDPNSVTINKGDKVTFVNNDSMCHDVEVQGLGNSGAVCAMQKNDTWSQVFETAGTFKFRCRAHSSDFDSGMVGSVVVVDPNAPPPPQKTPGLELVALLGALVLAGAVFAVASRRRRP